MVQYIVQLADISVHFWFSEQSQFPVQSSVTNNFKNLCRPSAFSLVSFSLPYSSITIIEDGGFFNFTLQVIELIEHTTITPQHLTAGFNYLFQLSNLHFSMCIILSVSSVLWPCLQCSMGWWGCKLSCAAIKPGVFHLRLWTFASRLRKLTSFPSCLLLSLHLSKGPNF